MESTLNLLINGALVVTPAMLLHLINCRFTITYLLRDEHEQI